MLEEKTHEPVPLRAYDVDGNLIAPQAGDWMKKLQGADVLVKFTVMHQWFGQTAAPDTKKDNYYADIDEIRVLKAPQPTPTPQASTREYGSRLRLGWPLAQTEENSDQEL